jgi:CDP-glycerol glycerophosphotransferase
MPLLTFVLVVHREQAYLAECAQSLLENDFGDVELVAVDDASPDHGTEILDELAERDPRVRVEHLASRVGLGAARNLALEMAAGEYLWFVSTTDLVAPGSLGPIARALMASSPDVLLVRHSHRDQLGRTRAGVRRELLGRVAERGPGPLDRFPAVADSAPDAWNKGLRSSLLRRLDVRFGAAGHSELSVTWPALLAADRIAAAPVEGYVRRRPDNAVRDRHVAGSPFDVFGQYDEVFAFADAGGQVPAERRRLVPPAMLRHQLALLERVPERDRREFFRRMSAQYRERTRGDEPALGGRIAPLRSRLVQRGSYAGFRALERALDARRAVVRTRRAASRRRARRAARSRRARLQRYYRSRLREPIDPNLAVFAAYWYRGYSCNPRAIYEKARELVPDMRAVWVVRPESVATFPPDVEHVVAGTREYYDVIARAHYLVNNVNFPNHLVKREGTVHVMTHHGTPLKTMGLDQRNAPVSGTRHNFAAMLRRCRRWDYSISQNAFSTLVWERTYPTRYESLEVGYPRNDVLATASDDNVRRIRDELGIAPGRTAVLYAPTHREYHRRYVPVLDLGALADGLGDDFIVLARVHYFYESDARLRELHRAGRILDVAAHPSIEQLCLAADVLVTDYSSIMFDYAVLDRPIVIHAPDWEVYREMRGTNFDLMAEPPGVVTRTETELVEAFRSDLVDSEEASRARAAFRARFCSLDDGRAAERVVRRVWFGERLPAAEPEPSVA